MRRLLGPTSLRHPDIVIKLRLLDFFPTCWKPARPRVFFFQFPGINSCSCFFVFLLPCVRNACSHLLTPRIDEEGFRQCALNYGLNTFGVRLDSIATYTTTGRMLFILGQSALSQVFPMLLCWWCAVHMSFTNTTEKSRGLWKFRFVFTEADITDTSDLVSTKNRSICDVQLKIINRRLCCSLPILQVSGGCLISF